MNLKRKLNLSNSLEEMVINIWNINIREKQNEFKKKTKSVQLFEGNGYKYLKYKH